MINTVTHSLDRGIKFVASTMIAAIFLITLLQVVLRYVFSVALPWSAEAAQVLLVYAVMLVAAFAAGKGSHFTVRTLFESLSLQSQIWLGRFHNVMILCFAGFAAVYGWRLAFSQMESRLPALGLPVGVVYAALPLGAVLMCIYAFAALIAPPPTAKD